MGIFFLVNTNFDCPDQYEGYTSSILARPHTSHAGCLHEDTNTEAGPRAASVGTIILLRLHTPTRGGYKLSTCEEGFNQSINEIQICLAGMHGDRKCLFCNWNRLVFSDAKIYKMG